MFACVWGLGADPLPGPVVPARVERAAGGLDLHGACMGNGFGYGRV